MTESQAATVMWDAPANVTGVSDVQTDGTLIGAWSLRGDGLGPQGSGVNAPFTVNGVAFTNVTNVAGSGNLAISSSGGGTVVKIGLNATQQTNADVSPKPYWQVGQTPGGSTAYKALMQQTFTVQQSGVNRPMILTVSGLSQNTVYSIQLWTTWSNSGGFGGGTKYAINSTESPLVDNNTTDTHGGLGQYITGTFATGPGETQVAIQAISGNVSPPGGGSSWVNVNALQIRTATKSTWMKNAKYGIGANWNPFPAGVTGANPVNDDVAMNDFLKIVAPETESNWSKANNNFNVTAFANQVAQTGAGYVIFGVGGSTGMYSAPSARFEQGGGVGSYGFANGEFTSKRDLVEDMATALSAKGIKLIVYFASEGPMKAYYVQTTPGAQKRWPGVVLGARDGVFGGVARAAYSATFRTTWHKIISDWSDDWKSKVAGWWIDGLFPSLAGWYTGYRVTSWPDGSPNDPVANLNALIAATKSGNPLALVACNPMVNRFYALSENQDYTAGETGRFKDGKGKFYDYPNSQFVTVGSNTQIQTHYYGPLGTWWNADDRKYVDEEIINYISSVNNKGGTVTLSVGVNATGEISDIQMAQLEKIKAALKPSMAPAVTPKPIANFTNLALYKPAYLVSYNGNLGDARLDPGAAEQQQPHCGVDGDTRTFTTTAAADKIGYSYIVDLEKSTVFDQVVITFHSTHFSTNYSVEYSPTGLSGSWLPINSGASIYTNTTGGVKVHSTGTAGNEKTGRYLRVTSHLPFGVNQTGIRMGIVEFTVCNVAAAAPSTKEVVWGDEEFPAGSTVTTGGAGTWGTASKLLTPEVAPSEPEKWWATFEASDDVPHPMDGVKIHWNKLESEHNEHGFRDASEPLRVSSGDTLYCDYYLDPANPTTEILLRWKDATGVVGTARWGADSITGSGTYIGPLPNNSGTPITGQWVRLSVPVDTVGVAGKTLTGMSFATYGGRTYFDRVGKITP